MSDCTVICKQKISSQKFGVNRTQACIFVHRCLKILALIDFSIYKKKHFGFCCLQRQSVTVFCFFCFFKSSLIDHESNVFLKKSNGLSG